MTTVTLVTGAARKNIWGSVWWPRILLSPGRHNSHGTCLSPPLDLCEQGYYFLLALPAGMFQPGQLGERKDRVFEEGIWMWGFPEDNGSQLWLYPNLDMWVGVTTQKAAAQRCMYAESNTEEEVEEPLRYLGVATPKGLNVQLTMIYSQILLQCIKSLKPNPRTIQRLFPGQKL